MKYMLKNYLAFTSCLYKIIVFLIYPLAVIGMFWILGANNLFSFLNVFVMAIFIEVMLDYWNFGGIVSNNGANLNYIKSAKCGRTFIQQVVLCESLRKASSFLIIFVIHKLFGFIKGEYMVKVSIANMTKQFTLGEYSGQVEALSNLEIINYILIGYILLLIATTIGRFFETLTIQYFIWGITSTLFCIITIWIYFVHVSNVCLVENIVLWIVAIGSTILQLTIIMKQVRSGYYDK